MKTFVCQICNHISFDQAPVDCPVCGMAIENFENIPDAVKLPADNGNHSETEKKHLPHVVITKECDLHHSTCTKLLLMVGEVEHVMEREHYITFIDVYRYKTYMNRIMLSPQRMRPAAELHLNIEPGELRIIAHCNVHGSWMSKIHIDHSSISGQGT